MGDKVEGGGVSKAGPTVINGSGAAGENSAQEAGVLSQSAAMEDSEPCTQPMPDEDLEDNDSHEDSVEIDQSQVKRVGVFFSSHCRVRKRELLPSFRYLAI